MHGSSQPNTSGGHNNACGDCSVRYKSFGKDISPVDWWLVNDINRMDPAQTTDLLPYLVP